MEPKNMDIATKTDDYIDATWLETNSPNNRRVIQEAYKTYNKKEIKIDLQRKSKEKELM